jgi:hypothetical protein
MPEFSGAPLIFTLFLLRVPPRRFFAASGTVCRSARYFDGDGTDQAAAVTSKGHAV